MYGTCSECGHDFADQWEFGQHDCVMKNRKMTRLELAMKLYKNGKMSEKMYRQVLKEER